MRTPSANITKQASSAQANLIKALLATRLIQGWRLDKPEEAALLTTEWGRHLDEANVRPELYRKLVDLAVIHRTKEISQGKSPTPLTVELLISCYYQYRSLKLEELAQINNKLEYYRSLRHRYQTRQIELSVAARQGKFHAEISEEEFLRVSQEVIDDLEQKKESFKEDNWL